MEQPIDVIVSGHLCLDLLPRMDHVRLNELASPGRLFEIDPLNVSTGGAVSNTGLALHRLGVNVRLMSSVGDDLLGGMIVSFLENRDPTLAQYITIKRGVASSYTVVLAPEKVDRIFLHCTGTNAVFTSQDVDYHLVANAKIFHLGYPSILPALIINDGEELALLFQRAKQAGTLTSLDTSLPDPDGASGRVDWKGLLQRTLPHVDIFIPSIQEILFMLRRADFERWRGEYLLHVTRAYLNQLADDIFRMGASAIVGFKLGDRGIYLCGNTADHFARFDVLPIQISEWANQRVWHAAFQVEVAGTTGAGDAAYAGFLTALLKGLSLQDAARWVCAVGACSVEATDATSGIQRWEATQQRLASGWGLNAHMLL